MPKSPKLTNIVIFKYFESGFSWPNLDGHNTLRWYKNKNSSAINIIKSNSKGWFEKNPKVTLTLTFPIEHVNIVVISIFSSHGPLWVKSHLNAMIEENRHLVTDELVEFEKYPFEFQDCRKIMDRLRGMYKIYQFNKGSLEDVNM